MIVDREQLIQLLVKKTGLEKEQVQDQLSELIKKINKAAEQGKTFQVEGFGTFSVDDGDLHFTPEDRLETEINNKYAGMKPIELIGAFRQSEDEIPEMESISERSDKENWSFDEEAADIKKASEIESDSETEESAEDSELPGILEEQSEVEVGESEEDESVVKEEPEVEPEPIAEQNNESIKEEPKEKSAKRKTEDRDVIGKFLVAAVVLIVLGVTGFFIYDMGLLDNSSGGSSVSNIEQSKPKTVQQTEKSVKSAGNTEKGQNQTDQTEENVETGSPAEAEPESSYGLRGEVNKPIDGGYTIVVHSLKNRTQAEKNRQALADQGFRAIINGVNINGTMYYRVGIGQFESISAAQEAIAKIPEEYQNNNFIKRIQ